MTALSGNARLPRLPRLPRGPWAPLMVWAILLLAYAPTFLHALSVWGSDSEFSFAYLSPPIALALLWVRRDVLRGPARQGTRAGLVMVAAGLLVLLAATRLGIHALAGLSFWPVTLGLLAYLYGPLVARAACYPVSFFTITLLLYRGLLSDPAFLLQRLTADASAVIASMIGSPVRRVGLDLYVNHAHFVVAEACSGMHSLMALLAVGLAVVGLSRTSLPRQAFLCALFIPIVLFANIIRVTLVLVLSWWYGEGPAHGLFHESLSAVLFLGTFGLFMAAWSRIAATPRRGSIV